MNCIILFETDFTGSSKAHVLLTGERHAHVASACTLSIGASLRVGLLNGNMGTGIVKAISPRSLDLEVTLDKKPPAPLSLTLVLALPRPKALKRCVEAVAAMGVKNIYILETWRVEKSYWKSPELSEENLRRHLLLGLEQGCDTLLPTIEIRKRFKPFVEDELPSLIKNTRPLVAHPAAKKACPYHVKGPVTLAIGPEGGFIPYEIEALRKIGFEPVSFGPRTLRVEHAVPAIIGRIA